MATSIEKFRDKPYQIILVALIIFSNFCVLGIPFTYSVFDEGSITWHRNVWFSGAWFQYDRINEDNNFAGGYWNLPDYSVSILILILIAVTITTIAVFFTGRNRWRNVILQRIAAGIVGVGAIVGLTGTLLFLHYNNIQTFDPFQRLYIGFYFSISYFPLIFVMNLKNIIFSNQIPKPEITPPPPQEGLLMDEEKKDKKRRQLFKELDYIAEKADDEKYS